MAITKRHASTGDQPSVLRLRGAETCGERSHRPIMRILMLAQCYPPLIGGEERFAKALSVGLAARGHDVSVVTLSQNGLDHEEMDEGVRVYRVRSTVGRIRRLYSAQRTLAPPFPDPELLWAIRRCVRRERPDIVHAHNWLIHSFLPLKVRSHARLVVTLNDFGLVCATQKLIFRGDNCTGPGVGKCLQCARDHYGALKGGAIVVSHRLSAKFEKRVVDRFLPVSAAAAAGNRLDALPTSILPNFVPDDVPDAVDDVYPGIASLPPDEFLLFVGAYGHYKGVDTLLEAYAGLVAPPTLVIIGYTTGESPVRSGAVPPGVKILMDWPHRAVMHAWRRSMLGIAPSLWTEPFGIVLLEAMACGKPVIASRIGGIPGIVIDGETGILVPPGDAGALRQALTTLLDAPGLRMRMGQAGLRRVRQFRAASVVPRYEAAYRALLESPSGAAN